MSVGPGAAGPRRTRGASRADLEELLHGVRRWWTARDEDPSGGWVEDSVTALARGEKPGWYLPGPQGGLAFYARRGPAAFGHLHTEGSADAAQVLARALMADLPADVLSLDLGFTGLSPESERALAGELARTPGSTVIERRAMERALGPSDGRLASEPPAGVDRVPVSAVTTEALAELDRRAFAGSVDALLLGADPHAYRDALDAMLGGRFGRFLGEASLALLEPEPLRLVGAALSAERSARRAIILDLAVDPDRRRRGLGRFLLGWTLRALWALGYESARLWVSARNVEANELYRSFAFRAGIEATIYRWDRPSAAEQPHRSR